MANQNDHKNRRGDGGINKRQEWPCFICGRSFGSYQAQKKHISREHGKSTKGYDQMLERVNGIR
jgi:hypothetical protein